MSSPSQLDNQDAGVVLKAFSSNTSAHGIPHIAYASHGYARCFWAVGVLLCLCVFSVNAYWVWDKFQSQETNVNVKLQFEGQRFPAVTLCNLNPYKLSLVQKIPSMQKTLTAFSHAYTQSKVDTRQRMRRQSTMTSDTGGFEPVFAECRCPTADNLAADVRCVPVESVTTTNIAPKVEHICACVYNSNVDHAWPCYRIRHWRQDLCPLCTSAGVCHLPLVTADDEVSSPSNDSVDCVCLPSLDYCMPKPVRIRRLWEPPPSSPHAMTSTVTESTTTLSTLVTTPPPDFQYMQAQGFVGVTDEVALVSRAKESVIFTMASVAPLMRTVLSYGRHEAIQQCSFNGKQCDIQYDFKLRSDPTYGNCYTFLGGASGNGTALRAGPLYGLRVLFYANLSDYLPTTESAGVRLSVHSLSAFPFPDTYGRSAPTGFLSSFGVLLRKMNRLENDRCTTDGKNSDYIYPDYEYSVEGCYRSCFQQRMLELCGCGDPRFPLPPTNSTAAHCKDSQLDARQCLETHSDFGQSQCATPCKPPCSNTVYQISYSASRWPSGSLDVGSCNDNMSVEECTTHYKRHAAMIEVFYEQLGFEIFTETAAFTLTNMVADLGGHLGLWMGVSVLTCMEFCVLICDLLKICCQKWKNRKDARETAKRQH